VIEVSAAFPLPRGIRSDPDLWLRVFAGEPRRVPEAREFVARALVGCPARETLLTCVSELASNAIAHTASGQGGLFTVEVIRPASGVALVAVTDAGSPREPSVRDADELAEGGRGLALVTALASSWGHHRALGGGRTVWAQATWPVGVAVPASS
jgi:serine/threonine-protein kinase RsbW